MTVHVSFLAPAGIASLQNLAMGKPRIYEAVAVGSASSASAQDGEWALVGNAGYDPVLIAVGTTPDAGATAETSATSASFVLMSGQTLPVACKTGDKIDTAAIA